MADEYMIRTVADFAGIPEEKLLECLNDFMQFLALVRQSAKFDHEMQMAFNLPAGSLNLNTEVFHWVDDDRREFSALELVAKETGETVGRIDLPSNNQVEGAEGGLPPKAPSRTPC